MRRRRAGSSRGTSRSTAADSRRPRRPPSSATGVAWSGAGSRPATGGTGSSGCAWSASWRRFAWEKAVGDEDELAWWASAALAGARWLDEPGPGARRLPGRGRLVGRGRLAGLRPSRPAPGGHGSRDGSRGRGRWTREPARVPSATCSGTSAPTVVSVDLEPDMLRHRLGDAGTRGRRRRRPAPLPVAPLRRGGRPAFVLNHVADHVAALRELGRVTRPGGVLLASVFGNERSALKEAVDGRLAGIRLVAPGVVRRRTQALGGRRHRRALRGQRPRGGARPASVRSAAVDVGLDSPELVVRYRLSMAHCPGVRRRAGRRRAGGAGARGRQPRSPRPAEPFRPVVLELVATVS